MSSNSKSKKKKKYTRIYSELKTGCFYYVRIPKKISKGTKTTMRKYDNKARKHASFVSK